VLDVDTRIKGIAQAQRQLAFIDAGVRRELRKDAKRIVAPIVNDAKAAYPRTAKDQSPLRGVNYAWKSVGGDGFPYVQARAKRGVKFTCDISRAGRTVFRVRQTDPAAAVLETAGRRSPNGLGRAVTQNFGSKNRFMWKAAQNKLFPIRREMQSTINAYIAGINRRNQREAA